MYILALNYSAGISSLINNPTDVTIGHFILSTAVPDEDWTSPVLLVMVSVFWTSAELPPNVLDC